MAASTPPYQVRAVYEYSSPHDDDLSFPNGQLITVTDEEDADWYYGEYTDTSGQKQEGLFPRNFVKIHEPETPPRPSRPSRQKKDPEQSPVVNQAESANTEPQSLAQVPEPAPNTTILQETKAATKPPPQELSVGHARKSSENTNEASSNVKKDIPPQVNEKPTSGSFRDRINAFNKPAAPPVAPKPGGPGSSSGTGFIKKAFVAPPPSKNAFIPPPREAPPQKIYRRDEDPEIMGQSNNAELAETATPPQIPATIETDEDQPKPTSLKDRIALLQKQQMEQAARHAEGPQKKEKPKRPAKKHMESQDKIPDVVDDDDGQDLEKVTSAGRTGSHLAEDMEDESVPRDATSAISPQIPPSRDFQSDANDADQSGAGDTEEGEETSTGRDDSDAKPRAAHAPPETDIGDEEDDADEEEDENEEQVDPEVRRRMEIRERMAKMSGGMGMAGMFGPPGGMPSMASKKQASVSSERRTGSGDNPAQTSRAPPVPTMPMPGLQRVRSPEEASHETEVTKEQSETHRSITQGREPEQMPDVEDMEEEPVVPQRRSLERPAPPPVPQGKYLCVMNSQTC